MKKYVYFVGAIASLLTACATNFNKDNEAPVMSAYYSDWDRAVRADVDMQNMYIGTPSKITKPIDMYMAMALALKYNFTRRLATYQENLVKSNITPTSLPNMIEDLGYENISNSVGIPADLKMSWNLLDLSSLYYQNGTLSQDIAMTEQGRKVINNILLEARSLYWKALVAQRMLPVIDNMNEYLVRVVDELNARENELISDGKKPSTNLLLKKRKYLESIRELADLRRKLDTAQTEFVGLLGFFPSTEIKLAGAEYGNFKVPSMRAKLQQLEWIALTNRPELRVFDAITSKEELELVVKDFENIDNTDYNQDPNYYNKKWSKESRSLSMSVFEDIRYQGTDTYNSLARQRVTNIVINQVYLSWAMYQSAIENYYLTMGVATTSEDIAEDITDKEGANKAVSHLESARAIIDEANASLAYVDVQEAIGRLYTSIGVDPINSGMLSENPSDIAIQIRETLDKWRDGIFTNSPTNALSLSNKKPPVDISSQVLVPNIEVGTGTDISIKIPDEVFEKVKWSGDFKTIAGSLDDAGLPKWLEYDEETHTFTGKPSIDDAGNYRIKVYAMDGIGNSAVLSFTITVTDVYLHTMEYKGLTGYRKAQIFHRCTDPATCIPNNEL